MNYCDITEIKLDFCDVWPAVMRFMKGLKYTFLFAVGNERTRVTCKSCDAPRFGLIGRDLYCLY